uniref:Uncharacterized protein n=1 Tax=viral metagenome TaxID=1070528 RepID=A0A6H2A2D0_9ZZZZ
MSIKCRTCGKELKKRFENDEPLWCAECRRKQQEEFDQQLAEFARLQNARLEFQAWHDEWSD